MDTRYHYVDDLQDDGMIKEKFACSEENVSDVATKNVTCDVMRRHEPRMLADKDFWNMD